MRRYMIFVKDLHCRDKVTEFSESAHQTASVAHKPGCEYRWVRAGGLMLLARCAQLRRATITKESQATASYKYDFTYQPTKAPYPFSRWPQRKIRLPTYATS